MLPIAVRQFVNRAAYITANNWLGAGEGRRTSILITGERVFILCAVFWTYIIDINLQHYALRYLLRGKYQY